MLVVRYIDSFQTALRSAFYQMLYKTNPIHQQLKYEMDLR